VFSHETERASDRFNPTLRMCLKFFALQGIDDADQLASSHDQATVANESNLAANMRVASADSRGLFAIENHLNPRTPDD